MASLIFLGRIFKLMKVVFLDRDGVINRYPGDHDYVKSWKEFYFLPRVKTALKELISSGFKIFIVSNQAGVAKGLFSQDALDLITANMLKGLGNDIKISGAYYCTHRSEDNCPCRKPKTGLIDLVKKQIKKEEERIDAVNSYFIGDTIRDIETGKKARLKTVLVFSGKEKPENKKHWQTQPDFTARDLYEATKIILKG